MSNIQENRKQPIRASIASFIGTMIEWYDFYLYATASALVFGPLFFPNKDPFISTLASFGTFAVGFLARPLGGMIFGHIGDKIGRKKSLVTTLTIMGFATVGIGLLPTYAQIGVMAPVCLILLRVLQGIAVGGEWGGAVLMAGEHAPEGRRTFFASFAQLGSPAGMILSILAFKLVTSMDEAVFLDWGWRLPFLFSGVLFAVGFAIRISVNESPEFAKLKADHKVLEKPVVEVFRTMWGYILLGIGANAIGVAGTYFTSTLMINYTTTYLLLDKNMILNCLFWVAVIEFTAQLMAAWLAQKIGDVQVLSMMALLTMVAPYPMFMLVETGHPAAITAGLALTVVGVGGFYAVSAGFMSSLFPTRIRYTAISMACQLCGAIAGFTPLVGAMLAQHYKAQWWPLALFCSILGGISLVCVTVLARRTISDIPVGKIAVV